MGKRKKKTNHPKNRFNTPKTPIMKKNRLLFVLLLTLLGSCKKSDDKGSTAACNSITNTQILVHEGLERAYVLYVPNSYTGNRAVPLLFNFHGFGGRANDFMKTADMRALAESETFILVYPQGSCLAGSPHWNACPPGGENKSEADDLGFVTAIINELSSEYRVDSERIYAAGYSNGGMMAYGLANYKSDLIAAVASVSGAMLDCTGATTHPMPVVHLHGTNDAVLPYSGNSDWNAVQATLDHWINFNHTSATPTVSSDTRGGMTIEHYVYAQGDNAVAVEHYKYLGGEHVWFNATYEGQSTAELVWNFVSRYDINGLR